MARARDPNREIAKQMYLDSNGEMLLKDIAAELSKSDTQIRKWKNLDKWDGLLKGNVTNETKGNVTNETKGNVTNGDVDISWVDIETEYVTDMRKKPCTLKGLAEKYGVSYQRIRDYSAENDWAGKRNNHQTITKQKTAEKIAELTSDDAAQATARHFEASNKLLDILEGAISTPGEFNKVVEKLRVSEDSEEVRVIEIDALAEKRLATVVSTLASIQKMQRETLDIRNAKQQAELEKTRSDMTKDDLSPINITIRRKGDE